MIEPTRAYAQLPALSPGEAAGMIADAIVHKPPRVVTRLGQFARAVELVAPRMGDMVNGIAHRMFPDSAAAIGGDAVDAAPTDEAVMFAHLLRGLHW
jgi:hypothetical protein